MLSFEDDEMIFLFLLYANVYKQNEQILNAFHIFVLYFIFRISHCIKKLLAH